MNKIIFVSVAVDIKVEINNSFLMRKLGLLLLLLKKRQHFTIIHTHKKWCILAMKMLQIDYYTSRSAS